MSARGLANGAHTRPDRRPRGVANGQSVLCDAEVVAIRKAYARGGISQEQIALDYDTHQPVISLIVRGLRWRHAGGPITRRGKAPRVVHLEGRGRRTRCSQRGHDVRTSGDPRHVTCRSCRAKGAFANRAPRRRNAAEPPAALNPRSEETRR